MRAIDLFSGPGGLTLGLKKSGISPVASVELNKDAFATYALHTSPAEHYCDDIQGISFKHLRKKIDVVYGGPPCQPFSLGGLRKGHQDARDMIPAFIRVLTETEAPNFIMENVPGLAMKYAKPYLGATLSSFLKLGYKINWGILNAADYGVPQKRKRLIVFGSKILNPLLPAPTHGPGAKHPHVVVSSILSEKPIGIPAPSPVKYASNPDLRPSPYAGHVYNGGGRPINMTEPCHTILASFGGHKTHWVDTQGVAVEYHRHLMNGGAPWTGEVPGARRLSPEEAAMIQTFPLGMKFVGPRSSQYTQIGDAVPPLLAEVLGRAFVSQFDSKAKQIPLSEKINSLQQLEMF